MPLPSDYVKQIQGFLTWALIALMLTSCGSSSNAIKSGQPSSALDIKEVYPGILQGYLEQGALPNSLELLAPPPVEGSAGWELDQEKADFYVNHTSEERREQAVRDTDLSFPNALLAFNDVLPFPITEESAPHTYMILRRSLADAGLSTYAAKNYYQRARPFAVNQTPVFSPEDVEKLRNDGSYPSGHTAIGWNWALILVELFPEHTDAILERGKAFGVSRNICNVHWHSDVEAGRTMGSATFARLHADSQFQIDMAAAKREIQSLQNSN